FGLLGSVIEILNVAIENGFPYSIGAPAFPVVIMLVLFASWGVAGFRAARALRSIQAGLLAAVSSAAICMLIAVASGFIIQFFLASPAPAYVSTWAEFKRSNWTDARAFAIANTLDSAFTHLLVAPLVALLIGLLASFLALKLPIKGAVDS